MLKLSVRTDDLRMKTPFVIAGHVFDAMPTLVVTLQAEGCQGRGEAAGVYYLDDAAPGMTRRIEAFRSEIEAGLSRADLQTRLPPGGARNALDCALWDLEAARAGQPVWRLAGLNSMRPLITTMTCGAEAPEAMARTALGFAAAKAIKLKLTGEPDLDARRVEAVRRARPDVWLSIDGNGGYALDGLREVLPVFARLGVALVEQPLPPGEDQALDEIVSPIPLAADESAQCSADLPALVGRYKVVNIKLDKCGGLTEALAMARAARRLGLDLMVGNMGGSSWAMAAAFVVGQSCDIVDLDGPPWLARDRSPSAEYHDGRVWCGEAVWGGGGRISAVAERVIVQ